jgi:hypothetical protein
VLSFFELVPNRHMHFTVNTKKIHLFYIVCEMKLKKGLNILTTRLLQFELQLEKKNPNFFNFVNCASR